MLASHFFIALLATVLFIVVLHPFATRIGLTDKPCHRKQHKSPTPLIGGLAAFFAIVLTMVLTDLRFPHQIAYVLACMLLVVVGLADDYKGLGVKIRMVAQIGAGLIMTEFADIKIVNLGDLLFIGDLNLGGFATVFTLFAVVGGVNAFNMIDGIDGLAGSLTLVSMLAIALIAWLTGDVPLLHFCSVIIAALIAFLAFNLRIFGRPSALIFMGDTGSTVLGFTVCWLAIYASQHQSPLIAPTTVLWVIAIPLFDSVCIMLRRISRGRSPFEPDREHLHHIMTITGYSVNQVVIRLAAYGTIMALIGITADLLLNLPDGLVLLGFIGLFICHYWGINYAWTILKITRYLRTRRKISEGIEFRRKGERRVNESGEIDTEQRSAIYRRKQEERRFIPTEIQLEQFYRCEEKMDDPAYNKKLKDTLAIFWLNLYIGSK